MGTFKNIEEAKEFFKGDKVASNNGIVIESVSDDNTICSMEIRDDHKNPFGAVLGCVIYTLANFAFAVNANNDHNPTVALEANINYLSSPKGTRLIATSEKVKSGKSTGVYKVMVKDDLGKDVALFVGTGYKL
jgi:acyl-CoA thioesterase